METKFLTSNSLSRFLTRIMFGNGWFMVLTGKVKMKIIQFIANSKYTSHSKTCL